MSEREFLTPAARELARRAVADAEAETSAEIVVAVRRVSGRYREADYLCGFAAAVLALLLLLYLPTPFPLWAFAPDVTLSFALGALAGSRVPPLRRLLVPTRVLRENTRLAARAAFLEGELTRLRGRNAVLVYVALFERRVEVVADTGIGADALGDDWSAALRTLDGALRPRPSLERLLSGVRGLGRVLGRTHPRADDDTNELPDEVSVG